MLSTLEQFNSNLSDFAKTPFYHHVLESERVRIIGKLMPGFIHDINGPIGSAHTIISYLEDRNHSFKDKYENNLLKKSDVEELIELIHDSCITLNKSINHAIDDLQIVRGLSNEHNRPEKKDQILKESLLGFVLASKGILKKHNFNIEVNCEPNIHCHMIMSWLTTAIFLWLELYMDSNPNVSTPILENHFTMSVQQADSCITIELVSQRKISEWTDEMSAKSILFYSILSDKLNSDIAWDSDFLIGSQQILLKLNEGGADNDAE